MAITNSSIAAIFRHTFNGNKNMMTPAIIRFGKCGKYLYELSTGVAMANEIYGVTILEPNQWETGYIHSHGKSICLNSTKKVDQYLKELEHG